MRKERHYGMTIAQISALVILLLLNCIVLNFVGSFLLDENVMYVVQLSLFLIWVWAVWIGRYRIARYEGPFKRGLRIRRETLSEDAERVLRQLSSGVRRDDGFIRLEEIDGCKALIRGEVSIMRNWPWIYVAYVDLSVDKPTIEYRTGIVNILIVVPFTLTIIGIPIIALMLVLNHRSERKNIHEFILKTPRILSR